MKRTNEKHWEYENKQWVLYGKLYPNDHVDYTMAVLEERAGRYNFTVINLYTLNCVRLISPETALGWRIPFGNLDMAKAYVEEKLAVDIDGIINCLSGIRELFDDEHKIIHTDE